MRLGVVGSLLVSGVLFVVSGCSDPEPGHAQVGRLDCLELSSTGDVDPELDRAVLDQSFLPALNAAIDRFEQALATEGAGSHRTLSRLHQVARLLLDANELAAARMVFPSVVAGRRQVHSGSDPRLAESLIFSGRAARYANDRETALRHYQEARSILERIPVDQELALQAMLHQAFADWYRGPDPQRALTYYDQAIALRRQLTPEGSFDLADGLTWRAWLSLRRGLLDDAQRMAEEAHSMVRRLGFAAHNRTATLENILGDLARLRADDAAARRHFQATSEILAAARSSFLPGYSRLGCPLDGFKQRALAALRAGRSEEGFWLAQTGRAPSHLDFVRLMQAEQRDPRLGEQMRLLRLDLLSALDALARLRQHQGELWDEHAARQLVGYLHALVAQRGAEMRLLDLKDANARSMERLQALIPERSALVGYVSQMDTNDWDPSLRLTEAWAYVLRPDRPIAWHRLWQRNLDDGVIQDGKSPLQPEVFLARAAAWNGDLGADRDLDRCRRVFFETYIAPLLTDLSGIDTIIVDGSFPFLDLAVFPDGTLLTDRFETTYVPSALVWQTLRETSAPRTTGRALIAVASPSPTAPAAGRSLEELLPLALKERRVRQIRDTIGRDSFVPGQLPDLPWAVAEIRAIAPLFSERDAVLIGEDTDRQLATLARRGELREFEVIHFAGHTLRDTLLERSALALVNRSAPPIHGLDDGLLELPEVMLGWELQAELVTLSACESVRVSGASRDEFLGLTGPLFGRGARAVISSRWPVDDVATALLMQRFYSIWLAARAEHGRASATRALSDAKRWLRNYTLPDGSRPFEHPVFWSGFLLYGVDDGAMPEVPTSSSRR